MKTPRHFLLMFIDVIVCSRQKISGMQDQIKFFNDFFDFRVAPGPRETLFPRAREPNKKTPDQILSTFIDVIVCSTHKIFEIQEKTKFLSDFCIFGTWPQPRETLPPEAREPNKKTQFIDAIVCSTHKILGIQDETRILNDFCMFRPWPGLRETLSPRARGA